MIQTPQPCEIVQSRLSVFGRCWVAVVVLSKSLNLAATQPQHSHYTTLVVFRLPRTLNTI